MAGSVIPVQVGKQSTQLSGTGLNDCVIYNTDTVNAVWLGNKNSVVPHNGMRLGPLGTLNWRKDSGLAFACVDTGVTAPVSLNVSNDVTDIVNPVDVATATAIQILAHGVPNVLLTKTLYNDVVNDGETISVDVSGQGSLQLQVLAPAGNVMLQCVFSDAAGSIALDGYYLSIPYDSITGFADGEWELPIANAMLNITVSNPSGPVTIAIVGSNRIATKLRQLANSYVPRILTYSGNFVAGTRVFLTPQDGVTEMTTRYNGPVTISIFGNVAAVGAQFQLAAMYATLNSVGPGALDGFNLYPPTSAKESRDWVHASVPCMWAITPVANAAAATVFVHIIPAGSGY